MIKTLNIVNGTACINIMKEAKIKGDFLPWKDFLHEGPVPAGLSLEELSTIRAKFIASHGLGDFSTIKKDFEIRDQKLKSYKEYDKIILWFEHDLYDQLQMLQILTWFSTQDLSNTELTLICSDKYLGESSVQQIQKLLLYSTPIVEEHLDLAQEAWEAFTSETPKKWASLLTEETEILPFLKGAVYRMLQEYPSTKYGLSRTEYQALQAISDGQSKALNIFKKSQSLEGRKFMGDVLFWKILDNFEAHGVIKKEGANFHLTPLGKEVLEVKKNWLNITNIQRSIGGVTLTNDNLWCWDMKKETIKQYYYSEPLNTLLKVK